MTKLPPNRELRIIQNNDINNILGRGVDGQLSPRAYADAVDRLLDGGPNVLAQDAGLPDPVLYRSAVATSFDKHLDEIAPKTWPGAEAGVQVEYARRLREAGTDPFSITIDVCRRRNVLILPSYRMNAEDWYNHTYLLSDFGRAHPEWVIRLTPAEIAANVAHPTLETSGALDPAVPAVYEHRMKIFTEVANDYDVDGIEFNFKRWNHMISDPHKNHPVLTQMVRDTRAVLDEAAAKRGRERLLLGVRVGHTLAGESEGFFELSCLDLGLDVATWIKEGLVDYVSPSRFSTRDGLPETREFVELARGADTGVYPTVMMPVHTEDVHNMTDIADSEAAGMMRRWRDMICEQALECYNQGADGISTFNWSGHQVDSPRSRRDGLSIGLQAMWKTMLFAHRYLGSPEDLKKLMQARPTVTNGICEWRER